MNDPTEEVHSLEDLRRALSHDPCVKVAGIDVDGMLRGKLMTKPKFHSVAKDGFGFCSIIFGWDMHDQTYGKELNVSNKENGYRDIIAIPDLHSYRRIPWEKNTPFFFVKFFNPQTKLPLFCCPRSLLSQLTEPLKDHDLVAMAGVEYEFYNFRSAQDTTQLVENASTKGLQHLTDGNFGYSLTRPIQNQDYYYGVFDACTQLRCPLESWHTESGPGVFEAALEYVEITEMADRAALFKLVVKCLGNKHGITPCFMAKPKQGLPGNSGHVHISLVDKDSGENKFYRKEEDKEPEWDDIRHLSDLGRHFLAGILSGLPDIMPIVAPTINSYKRLVENFWAPVTVSWGLEHRSAAIRLISPPTCSPKATRLEVRIPGADANPHLVLSAILALGWRGVEQKLKIPIPPLSTGESMGGNQDTGARLARSLREANTAFMSSKSIAREVFGDEFVDHFGGTRDHEIKLWEEAVTDWEFKRYVETI